MLLHQDARHREQPATVIGKPEIFGATDVDVAHPATLLRQPDSAPPEHLADHIRHVLPQLVLLVLVLHRRIRLAAHIVDGLQIGGDAAVVQHVRSRCVRQLGICRLQPGDEIQLRCALGGRTHGSSLRFSDRSNKWRNAAQNAAVTLWRKMQGIWIVRRNPATPSGTTALLAIGTSRVAHLIRLADRTPDSPLDAAIRRPNSSERRRVCAVPQSI